MDFLHAPRPSKRQHTFFLITTFRVIDFFMTDTMTLNRLVGTLATDIVKVGIATGASIAAAGFGVTLATGPILAFVVVGVGVGVGVVFNFGLNELDKKYSITDRVVSGLDEIESDTRAIGNRLKQKATRTAGQLTESVIDYTVDSMKRIVINTAKNTLNNFLFSKLRVF